MSALAHLTRAIAGGQRAPAALAATVTRYGLQPAGAAFLAVLYERKNYSQGTLTL